MSIRKTDRENIHRAGGLDPGLQAEIDDALGEMSIDQLLEKEEAVERPPVTVTPGPRRPGRARDDMETRLGRVIAIQRDDIFVDFGGGREQGVLPVKQFSEEEGLPEIGQAIEVRVAGFDQAEGLLLLSRKGSVLAADWDSLEKGQVVEARVTGSNTGGLEVKIGGGRGFMPISMIEMHRIEDLSPYVNRTLTCEIVEIDHSRGGNVVVSRRAVLEKQAEEIREQMLASMAEGKVVKGVVRSIMPYGAFVDIGGIDGLLHVGDMAWRRVADPHEIVKEGQEVEVKILKMDKESRRISLGLKQVLPDPWEGAAVRWPADSVVTGRVTRLADFGAFVELSEGVEGLVPMGEMCFERRVKTAGEVVKEGDVINVRVLSVDPDKKRISLSIKRVGEDPWTGASVRWPVGSVVTGVVKHIEAFGAFVELTGGVEGLVHISELGEGRVRTVADAVKEGQTVQAKVLGVDEERKRISLSIKQLASVAEYTGAAVGAEEAPAADKPAKKRKKPLKGGLD